MNRQQLINIHLILAGLLLPAIMMFAITGGLYTWGVKGGYESQTYKLPLSEPLNGDLASLVSFTQSELDKQQQSYPTGGAKLKSDAHRHALEWTGSQLDVALSSDKDSKLAVLEVKHTSSYRHLVQLHKAKGGYPFKVYAAILAIALLVILISGLIMAWNMPKYHERTAVALVSGVCVWLLVVLIS